MTDKVPHGGRASRRRHHGHSGELDRAGLIHRDVPTVLYPDAGEAIDRWDVVRGTTSRCMTFSRLRRAVCRRRLPSPRTRGSELDLIARGCIRTKAQRLFPDGGLAVLFTATSR